jgi:hypothetical protein
MLLLVGQPTAVGKATPAFHERDASQGSRQAREIASTSGAVDTLFTTGQAGPWPLGHLALNGATASVSHGYYILSNQNGYSAMVFPNGSTSLGNGTVSATFQLPTRGKAGVVARYTSVRDVVDYDDCWLDATSHLGCDAWENGGSSTLLAPRALGLNRTANHTLTLFLQGSTFSVSVDGKEVNQGHATHPLPAGQWGLYVIGKFSEGIVKGSFSRATIAPSSLFDTLFTTGQAGPWPLGHLAQNGATAFLSHGYYVLSNQAGYSAIAFPKGVMALGDGVISASFQLPTRGEVGVVARYTNVRGGIHYNDCWLDATSRVGCDVWENGSPSTLLAPRTLQLSNSIDHTLMLSLQGSAFSVSVDGGPKYRGLATRSLSASKWGLYVIGEFSQGEVNGSFSRATIINAGPIPAGTPSPIRPPKPTTSTAPRPRPTGTPSPTDTSAPTNTMPPTNAAQLVWTSRSSGTTQNLWDVSCPSAGVCVAVGSGGTILTSNDGGVTWANLPSGITQTSDSVSCPSTSHCVAVGAGNAILTSNDDGTTWTSKPLSSSLTPLNSVSCPSVNVCVGVSYDLIVISENGGLTWTNQPSGATKKLIGVNCPSVSECVAVGFGGTILTSEDGGVTWTDRPSDSTSDLERVSCATLSNCTAAGANTVLRSVDGGVTWTNPLTVTSEYLTGVSCSSMSTCVVVGHGNVILRSMDGGIAWTNQTLDTSNKLLRVSCPTASVCVAVGDGGTILTGETSG